jgi:chitin synthase
MLRKTLQVWRSDISSANQVFENPTTSLGIAILVLYVLWAIASLFISDPWPIVFSSIQYLILIPYYINVSDVVGFCDSFNIKNILADDDPVIELPKVETQNGKGRMEILSDEGLDEQYEQQLIIMKQRILYFGRMTSPMEKAQGPQNARRLFEALLVIAWTTTNFILVFVVLSITDVKGMDSDEARPVLESKGMHYMAGVMWTLAGLTGVKVIGSFFSRVMTMARGYRGFRNDGRDRDEFQQTSIT